MLPLLRDEGTEAPGNEVTFPIVTQFVTDSRQEVGLAQELQMITQRVSSQHPRAHGKPCWSMLVFFPLSLDSYFSISAQHPGKSLPADQNGG